MKKYVQYILKLDVQRWTSIIRRDLTTAVKSVTSHRNKESHSAKLLEPVTAHQSKVCDSVYTSFH